MSRRMYVRREFSGVPHIHPVEEEIRLRFQMHHRDFDRHLNRTRFEDDVIAMCMEVMSVEGRYQRHEGNQKHQANTAKFEDWIEQELQAAHDELRAEDPNRKIGRIRLKDRVHDRIKLREANKLKAEALCTRITVHKAERWIERQPKI